MLNNKARHDTTKLGSSVVQELKINQRRILIDSLEIGIPAPEQMIALGERQLPNGVKVGQLLNSKTLNYKKFTPHRDGLFCERIFGPVQSFVCACGKKKESVQGKNRHKDIAKANLLPMGTFESTQNKDLLISDKKGSQTIQTEIPFCPKCQVEYISKSVRRHRLGYIKLFSPVTHIWYLKGRPSYLSLFLGKRKKALTSLAYCNAYLVEQACFDLQTESLLKDTNKSVTALVKENNIKISESPNLRDFKQTKALPSALQKHLVTQKQPLYKETSLFSKKNKYLQQQEQYRDRDTNSKSYLYKTQKGFKNQTVFVDSHSEVFLNLLTQIFIQKNKVFLYGPNLHCINKIALQNKTQETSKEKYAKTKFLHKICYPFDLASSFVKHIKADDLNLNKITNFHHKFTKQSVTKSTCKTLFCTLYAKQNKVLQTQDASLSTKKIRYKVSTKLEAVKYFVETVLDPRAQYHIKTKFLRDKSFDTITIAHTKTKLKLTKPLKEQNHTKAITFAYKNELLQSRPFLETRLDNAKTYANACKKTLYTKQSKALPKRHFGVQNIAKHIEKNKSFSLKNDKLTSLHNSYIRAQTLPFLPSLICSFHLRDCLISFLQSLPCKEDIPIPMYCKTSRRYPLRDVHKFLAELRSTNPPNQVERLTTESITRFIAHTNKKVSKNEFVNQTRYIDRSYIKKGTITKSDLRSKSLKFTDSQPTLRNRAWLVGSMTAPEKVKMYDNSLQKLTLLPMGLHFLTNSRLIYKRFVTSLYWKKNDIFKQFRLDLKHCKNQLLYPKQSLASLSTPIQVLAEQTRMSLRGVLLNTFFDITNSKLFSSPLALSVKPFTINNLNPVGVRAEWFTYKRSKASFSEVQAKLLQNFVLPYQNQLKCDERTKLYKKTELYKKTKFVPKLHAKQSTYLSAHTCTFTRTKVSLLHSSLRKTLLDKKSIELRPYSAGKYLIHNSLFYQNKHENSLHSDSQAFFFRKRIGTYQKRLLHLVFNALPQNLSLNEYDCITSSFLHNNELLVYRENKDLLGMAELGYTYFLRKSRPEKEKQGLHENKDILKRTNFVMQNFVVPKNSAKVRPSELNCDALLSTKQKTDGTQTDTKQTTAIVSPFGSESISKWHINGAKEILLYTGGGALESLLKRFNTSLFCQFLLGELQTLRKHYNNQIVVECNKNKTTGQDSVNYFAFQSKANRSFKRNEKDSKQVNSLLSLQESNHAMMQNKPALHAISIKQSFSTSLPRYSSNISTDYSIDSNKQSFGPRYAVTEKSTNLFCRRIYRTTRRLKIVQLLMRSKRRPEWMLISVLPVLPPDLRPVLQMGDNLIVASDLNTLYQRVIYRNNRHYKGRFLDFHFVSSIHRLVQDAVDRLIENGKGGSTPFLTPGGRPLKSLSDILKGKRGRFRFNLLGKRVDFSGRSVIVVDPNLKIHECGLPKEMALELYKYLLIRQLLLQKRVSSIVNAKKLIKERKPFVWDILRQIIYYHPLLLNRAPTLHRLGIQAFQPKLIIGNAILLHPLVCAGFNADFDGDQMGVHLPLSPQARAEAWDLLWSRNNLLSPATGQPILLPSQDMVLGFYYMTSLLPYGTTNKSHTRKQSLYQNAVFVTQKQSLYKKTNFFCKHMLASHLQVPVFSDTSQVLYAYQNKKIDIHTPIWLKWAGKSENGERSQTPLEFRINTFGDQKKIYSTHQTKNKVYQGVSTDFLSFQIRTTVGRVLVNNLISTNQ